MNRWEWLIMWSASWWLLSLDVLHLLSDGRSRNCSCPEFNLLYVFPQWDLLNWFFKSSPGLCSSSRPGCWPWQPEPGCGRCSADTMLSFVDMVWICNERQVGDWRTAVLQVCLRPAAVSHAMLSRTAASTRWPLVSESRDVFPFWPFANTKGRVLPVCLPTAFWQPSQELEEVTAVGVIEQEATFSSEQKCLCMFFWLLFSVAPFFWKNSFSWKWQGNFKYDSCNYFAFSSPSFFFFLTLKNTWLEVVVKYVFATWVCILCPCYNK